MATKQHDWACWSELRVGDPAAQYAFWETLAKRQGWTVAFAEHVFTEYRKFLYLALTSPHPIAAPPPIQAAWDLHRELPSWRELPEAAEIELRLNRPASTEETRAAYTQAFGTYPPESIWAARVRKPARRRPWWLGSSVIGLIAVIVGTVLGFVLPSEWELPALLAWGVAVIICMNRPQWH